LILLPVGWKFWMLEYKTTGWFEYIGTFGGNFFHTPEVLKRCLYLVLTNERRVVMSQNGNLGRQHSKW
jgi:hypothetical protein